MNAPVRHAIDPDDHAYVPSKGGPKVFTTDDVLAMQAAGIFGPDEKVELLEGEIVVMQSKTDPHEQYKTGLIRWFVRRLPDQMQLLVEPTLYASATNNPDPDLMILPRGWKLREAQPDDVKLVVEVADSSLARDLGQKARIYAEFGVAEYWVVDVNAPRLIVHRGPEAGAWREIRRIAPNELIAPLAFPDLGLRLADIRR